MYSQLLCGICQNKEVLKFKSWCFLALILLGLLAYLRNTGHCFAMILEQELLNPLITDTTTLKYISKRMLQYEK
jgi:hypothetical protein